MTPFKIHPLLEDESVCHGFFGRQGGVSEGLYASLNTGLGSDDDPNNVLENRRRVAACLGTSEPQLQSLHQIHSRDVIILEAATQQRHKADGLVTKTPGIALSALSADCGPLLFHDPKAGIIGTCHAGWRGAVAGITDSTIDAMESIGADRGNIQAVLGPCISQTHYEVGEDFRDNIISADERFDRFFRIGPPKDETERKPHFDLKGFILNKLTTAGVTRIDMMTDCTYGRPTEYFSYRFNTHHGVRDYGRNISAIMLC